MRRLARRDGLDDLPSRRSRGASRGSVPGSDCHAAVGRQDAVTAAASERLFKSRGRQGDAEADGQIEKLIIRSVLSNQGRHVKAAWTIMNRDAGNVPSTMEEL